MIKLSLLLHLAALALAAFSVEARNPPPGPQGGDRAAAPWIASAPSPEPFGGFYHCLEKITEYCGVEIYGGIFDDDDGVSDGCCQELVGMGKQCHRGLLQATLELPEMAKIDKRKIKIKGIKIWSHCVFITNLEGGNSPLPILT